MVLCASLGMEYSEIMTTLMSLVNFLRASSALQHRLLRSFLTEVNAEFDELLLHNNVRWLSKGKVLEHLDATERARNVSVDSEESKSKTICGIPAKQ